MNTPNFELIGHILGDYHDLQSDGIVDAANRFPLGVVEEQIRLLELFEPAGNATLANRIAELERQLAASNSERDALAATVEELRRNAVPNEQGKNRYGVDVAYFRNVINRELNRSLINFRPSELARVFARLSRTADSSVLLESEFNGEHLQNLRAEAGRAGYIAGFIDADNFAMRPSRGFYSINEIKEKAGFEANQYAERVLRGEVE